MRRNLTQERRGRTQCATVWFPVGVYQAAKIHAIETNSTISDVICDAVCRMIGREDLIPREKSVAPEPAAAS